MGCARQPAISTRRGTPQAPKTNYMGIVGYGILMVLVGVGGIFLIYKGVDYLKKCKGVEYLQAVARQRKERQQDDADFNAIQGRLILLLSKEYVQTQQVLLGTYRHMKLSAILNEQLRQTLQLRQDLYKLYSECSLLTLSRKIAGKEIEAAKNETHNQRDAKNILERREMSDESFVNTRKRDILSNTNALALAIDQRGEIEHINKLTIDIMVDLTIIAYYYNWKDNFIRELKRTTSTPP